MFNLLHDKIREGLKKLNFEEPTEIQKIAIPEILKGNEILIIAPTGYGKTEAALLPIFDFIIRNNPKPVSVLYITPLRALNRDLLDRLAFWSKELDIDIQIRHGDTSKSLRRKQTKNPPHILITTPETMQAILVGKKFREHLKNVKFVIVDELHEIADSKRGTQLALALERLAEIAKFKRIGISATADKKLVKFIKLKKAVRIPIKKNIDVKVIVPKGENCESLAEILGTSSDVATKIKVISELIDKSNSCLIFVNTREIAEILASRLKIIRNDIEVHHSSLSQEARIEAERNFKEQKLKALVCTSSLELGIDIGSVDLVIQYNSPRQVTRLIQRVGRSGHRAWKKSRGVIIASDFDDIVESEAIVERAYEGKIEEIDFHEEALDVLAHAIVGLAIENKIISKERAYRIVTRAYPYRNLSLSKFEEVLDFLNKLRFIYYDGEFIKVSKCYKYYFENISTIPDEKKFFVKNIASGENIGMLDESFVARFADEGRLIIFKGSIWKIISVDSKEVIVEPTSEIIGAVPSWVGEEIPVPYEVARDVLKKINNENYLKKLERLLKINIDREIIPKENEIIVEIYKDIAVFHTFFGSKVNETLARYLAEILGSNIFLSTPYRIIFKLNYIVKDILFDPDILESTLKRNLVKSSLFKWKFLHVAKRFGVVSKDYEQVNIKKLMSFYENTVLFEETFREIFVDNLDIKRTKRILEKIKNGEIKVKILRVNKLSKLAELSLMEAYEIAYDVEDAVLEALKKRLNNRRLSFACIYCADWKISLKVKNVDENLRCEKCGSGMLAILKNGREALEILKKYKKGKKLKKDEKKILDELITTANLFMSYKKWAALVMAAHGIGAKTAKRVLMNSLNEEELYRNILKAERDYIRTRKFWEN